MSRRLISGATVIQAVRWHAAAAIIPRLPQEHHPEHLQGLARWVTENFIDPEEEVPESVPILSLVSKTWRYRMLTYYAGARRERRFALVWWPYLEGWEEQDPDAEGMRDSRDHCFAGMLPLRFFPVRIAPPGVQPLLLGWVLAPDRHTMDTAIEAAKTAVGTGVGDHLNATPWTSEGNGER